MTLEEIDKLINSLIGEAISVGSTMGNDSKYVSYKNIDLGKQALYVAIIEYGRECAVTMALSEALSSKQDGN